MRLLFNNKICKIWETLPIIVHGVYDRRMLRFKETQYCLWKTNFACRHLRHIQNDKYCQWHAASIKTAYNIVDCGRINCGKEWGVEQSALFITLLFWKPTDALLCMSRRVCFGRDHKVVGFTTTYAISAYLIVRCTR
jgi:hypothetical protein